MAMHRAIDGPIYPSAVCRNSTRRQTPFSPRYRVRWHGVPQRFTTSGSRNEATPRRPRRVRVYRLESPGDDVTRGLRRLRYTRYPRSQAREG